MELWRVMFGLTVAVWLPGSLPILKANFAFRLLWTGLYSLYALLPLLGSWRGWLSWTVGLLVSALVFAAGRGRRVSFRLHRPRFRRSQLLAPVVIRVLVVFFGGVFTLLLLADVGVALRAAAMAVSDDRVAIIASGLLLASFCANDLTRFTVEKFIGIPPQDKEAGTEAVLIGSHIGWIERAIVFALIAGGQPSAAALAVTAKSLARVADPTAQKEGFVEYFLIGTLTSLLAALTVAVLTRLSLGLSAF